MSRRHGTLGLQGLVTPTVSWEEGAERLNERRGWQRREWGFGGDALSWKMWRWDGDRKEEWTGREGVSETPKPAAIRSR